MDQWVTRKIHESGVIGGDTKLLYELGPTKVIEGNEAYVNQGGSPWGNSMSWLRSWELSKPIPAYIPNVVATDIVPAWKRTLKV